MNRAIKGYILAAIIGGSGTFGLWAHSHSAEGQIANRAGISSLVAANRIGKDIRRLDKRCHDLNMLIERKRSDLLRVELSPNQDDRLIELKSRLKNEIEDYRRLLEQQRKRLHDTETQESALIMQLSSA